MSPAYEVAAPVSVPEVSTPAKKYTAATGDSKRSDREAREKAERSAMRRRARIVLRIMSEREYTRERWNEYERS